MLPEKYRKKIVYIKQNNEKSEEVSKYLFKQNRVYMQAYKTEIK